MASLEIGFGIFFTDVALRQELLTRERWHRAGAPGEKTDADKRRTAV